MADRCFGGTTGDKVLEALIQPKVTSQSEMVKSGHSVKVNFHLFSKFYIKFQG
jgi:hypothetical protein